MRAARERAGISQRELGIRAGMDPGSASARVNRYERARHTPDYRTLSALARVLGLPVPYPYAEEDGLAELILTYRESRQES